MYWMVLYGFFFVCFFDFCFCCVYGDFEEVVVGGVCDYGVCICVGVWRVVENKMGNENFELCVIVNSVSM